MNCLPAPRHLLLHIHAPSRRIYILDPCPGESRFARSAGYEPAQARSRGHVGIGPAAAALEVRAKLDVRQVEPDSAQHWRRTRLVRIQRLVGGMDLADLPIVRGPRLG